MRGLAPDDPDCIHSAEELEEYVNRVGFLPLFANDIPGFSAEEHAASEGWWTGDPAIDPWEWRKIIASRGKVAYGKFFDKRAGFISKEWFPYFANYRRDGYDFDSLWDDELAGIRSKKIMDLFMEENEGRELFSFQIKEEAGFGRNREKNFEGEITRLQMQTYLLIRDFRRRKNKNGEEYGWGIAVYCTPEHLWEREHVTSRYSEEPVLSGEKIFSHMKELYPDADHAHMRKLLGIKAGSDARDKESIPFPDNLIKALKVEGITPGTLNEDQKSGLLVAIAQLKDKQQKVIELKYVSHMKNEEIGKAMNRAAGTVGTYHSKALGKLRWPRIAEWYLKGYSECLPGLLVSRGFPSHAAAVVSSEKDKEKPVGMNDFCLRLGLPFRVSDALLKAGIITLSDLSSRIPDPHWYKNIKGIGPKTAENITDRLRKVIK